MNKAQYKFDEKEHLHTLNGKPLTGTSSVVNVLSKPLTWWAAECAAVECLEAGVKIPTIREEYEKAKQSGNKSLAIKELEKKYPIFKRARYAHNESKKEAAEKGTDLHSELEKFVKTSMGLMNVKEFDKRTIPFQEWAEKNAKRFLASETNCYSERLWLGGVIDAIAELSDGSLAVIDFKSSKEAYPGQFLQACLYALQANENGLFDKT